MATNSIETNKNSLTLILLLPIPNSILILICCSSFVLMTIEGVLAVLPTLEQTQVAPAPTDFLLDRSFLDSSR
jgi:hypothetical protein